MNIFVSDDCPVKSAQALDDRRLIKAILEVGQILSSALFNLGYWRSNLYKPTHIHHPCVKWSIASKGNFDWLVLHGLALNSEYKYRFLSNDHRSTSVILSAAERLKDVPSDKMGGPFYDQMTRFENCTNISGNVSTIRKYRVYLAQSKWSDGKAKWTRRGSPDWYKPSIKKAA